jgi:hypothetical protein
MTSEVPPPDYDVHPAYRRALEQAGTRLERRGTVGAAAPAATRLEVCEQGVSLSLLVDEAEPCLVRDARHDGATGPAGALLDRFCALMVGRPLYEVIHHGVVRLESDLRDDAALPPVAGLVLPQNADPIFGLPLQFVRALRRHVGPFHLPPEQRGRWEERPGAAWLALTSDEQTARVQAALAEALRALAIPVPLPQIVEIRDGCRIVIAAHAVEERQVLGPALIAIERALQRALDQRLELLFETAADRNHRVERLIKITGS